MEITNRQSTLDVDVDSWNTNLLRLLHAEGVTDGEVSVSIVHDEDIHQLNRRFLKHDYPTDVLSFVLDRQGQELFGEIVVSADMAMSRCGEFDWSAKDELTLYLIHGALHLVGYDDKSAEDRRVMRKMERHYLSVFGVTVPRQDSVGTSESGEERRISDR